MVPPGQLGDAGDQLAELGDLTHAYADVRRAGLRRFYRRRAVSVVIPYLCWTVIYFLYLLPTAHYTSLSSALAHLAPGPGHGARRGQAGGGRR